jgi:hypothetical protein
MDRKLVRKSNYLIEASYKLSAIEQKIVLILASMIRPEDREFKTYPLRIQTITQLMGIETKNCYSYLKEATKTLLGKVFTIRTPDSELQTHWLSSAEYFEGRGEVELTFDPKLKPFLLQLKDRFTTYRLQEAIQLKSSFSIRMLELLRQYEKMGERTFELRKLRDLLGVEEDQYKLYADFKRRVILPAQKELAKKTNLAFDFEELKSGHAVDRLRIIIRTVTDHIRSHAASPKGQPVDPVLQNLLEMLPKAFQKQSSLKRLITEALKKSGFDLVARNIRYANERSNAIKSGSGQGKPGNYRNYLARALQEDFGLAFQEDRQAKQAIDEEARQKQEAIAKAKRAQEEKARQERESHDRAAVYQSSLSPEALAALREEAFARLDATQQALVRRKTVGAERLLKLAMNHICLERMKLSHPTNSALSIENNESPGN